MPIVPEITCSAAMTVEVGGKTFELTEGVNKNYDIILGSGTNVMKFLLAPAPCRLISEEVCCRCIKLQWLRMERNIRF